MIIDFSDEQLIILLETLAKAHIFEYMYDKDNSKLENFFCEITLVIEENGKKHIFDKVFNKVG